MDGSDLPGVHINRVGASSSFFFLSLSYLLLQEGSAEEDMEEGGRALAGSRRAGPCRGRARSRAGWRSRRGRTRAVPGQVVPAPGPRCAPAAVSVRRAVYSSSGR